LRLKAYIAYFFIFFICGNAFGQGAAFTENKGQWDGLIRYRANIPSGFLHIEDRKLRYIFYDEQTWAAMVAHPHSKGVKPTLLNEHVLDIYFENAQQSFIHPSQKQQGYTNFILGNEPSKWAGQVSSYGKVTYIDLYKNIDFEYGTQDGLNKYNFIIQPGGNLSDVSMVVDGAEKIELSNGAIKIKTSVNSIEEHPPFAYQLINEMAIKVPCKYTLKDHKIGFEVLGNYDHKRPLIIDPILVFSTYSGSTVDNFGFAATYDSRGCLYAGGIASAPTTYPNGKYPTTAGAFQVKFAGGSKTSNDWEEFPCDISISKYSPNGDSLLWATYLGGSKNEYPHSLIVNNNDQLIIFGSTNSTNFPVTRTAFDTTANGGYDIICSKLSQDGAKLVGSTYIGGGADDGFNISSPLVYNYADEFRGEVEVDIYNNIYIASCTRSKNFPVNKLAPQNKLSGDSLDGLFIKLDSNLTDLQWGSYWGGVGEDALYSIEIKENKIYVAGGTTSAGLKTSANAIHTAHQGGYRDGYIASFSNDSLQFISGTYIGTNVYNQVYFIEQDLAGNIYATGQTDGVWPVSSGVYSEPNSGQFIIKISSDLSQEILSTCFGSGAKTADLNPSAFLVDFCGNVYFSGWGSSFGGPWHNGTTTGLSITANAHQKTTDGNDFYLIVLSKNLVSRVYATYYGSAGSNNESGDHVDGGTSRFDPKGIVYQSVCSSCPNSSSLHQISNFPTSANAFSKTNPSPRCSNASFKLDFQVTNAVIANFIVSPIKGCAPIDVNLYNKSIGGKYYVWDFGDGTTSNLANPKHTYTAGKYIIKLIVIDSNSCNVADTAKQEVEYFNSSHADFEIEALPCNNQVKCKNKSAYIANSFWSFGDGATDTLRDPVHTYNKSGFYTIKLVVNTGFNCIDSITKNILISADTSMLANFDASPIAGCSPLKVIFKNNSKNARFYNWDFGDGQTSTEFEPTHVYINSFGKLKVRLIISDSLSCVKTDTIEKYIEVVSGPKADYTVLAEPCHFKVDFSDLSKGANAWYWNFGDSAESDLNNPSHLYKKGGTYFVKLVVNRKDSACTDSIIKEVKLFSDTILENLIPNAFTPDDDGIDDCWYIYGAHDPCDPVQFWIYNLWGELLWDSRIDGSCWPGKMKNGEAHPTGTYFVIWSELDADKVNKMNKRGTITLMRKN
jgi:gliding motility-associated-like protein